MNLKSAILKNLIRESQMALFLLQKSQKAGKAFVGRSHKTKWLCHAVFGALAPRKP
ncbi:hypothetical protein M2151_001158 [Lachnospiraceae bacterium PH1-22]